MSTVPRCADLVIYTRDSVDRANAVGNRDDLVDNFSKHKDKVERLLAEGMKKL